MTTVINPTAACERDNQVDELTALQLSTAREDHGSLADTELDAVIGGVLLRGSNSDDRKGGRYL